MRSRRRDEAWIRPTELTSVLQFEVSKPKKQPTLSPSYESGRPIRRTSRLSARRGRTCDRRSCGLDAGVDLEVGGVVPTRIVVLRRESFVNLCSVELLVEPSAFEVLYSRVTVWFRTATSARGNLT